MLIMSILVLRSGSVRFGERRPVDDFVRGSTSNAQHGFQINHADGLHTADVWAGGEFLKFRHLNHLTFYDSSVIRIQ